MKDACCPSTEQTTKMIYDTILTTPVKKKSTLHFPDISSR